MVLPVKVLRNKHRHLAHTIACGENTGCRLKSRTMACWRLLLMLVSVAGSAWTVQAKQLAVVADTANPIMNLSAAELKKIFNARTQNWPDGRPIKIVLRDPSCADMQVVLHKLLAMTPEQAQAFVQTHRGTIVVADSDAAVLQFVSTTRGAIGIVDLYSLTKDVKVLKVDGKLPVEQAYVLRENSP
jgi:ABC-type phosphate transport system substrate-binding protein